MNNDSILRVELNSDSALKDIESLLSRIQKYPATSEKIFLKSVRNINKVLKQDIVGRVKVFTGDTQKSITTSARVNFMGNIIGVVGPKKRSKNALSLSQTGRTSGKQPRPNQMERLKAWVEQKWYAYGEADKTQAAFRLARSISNKGVEGKDVVRTVKVSRKSWIEYMINTAINEILISLKLK